MDDILIYHIHSKSLTIESIECGCSDIGFIFKKKTDELLALTDNFLRFSDNVDIQQKKTVINDVKV